MGTKIEEQHIDTTAINKSKRRSFKSLCFALSLMSCICIFLLNVGFAQIKSTNTVEKNNQDSDENKTLTTKTDEQKTKIAALIKTDNSSSIDPQEEKIRRKAMAMILNISKANNPLINKQSASIFNVIKQKQKERIKSKREMKDYNQRNNKQINDFFQRFQKRRYQPLSYNGKHDDYTSYIQNFQTNSSR